MSFKLEITADSPEEFAQQLVTLAVMLAPKLAGNFTRPTVEPQPEAAVEVVDEPKKPRRSSKKNDTVIEHDAAEVVAEKENKEDVRATDSAGTDASDDGGASASAGDGQGETVRPAAGEPAADDKPAEVDAVAETAEPSMTIDELRKYTIDFLTARHVGLPAQKLAFAEMLKVFEVERIGDLPADKIDAFKALVDAKIAEAAR